MSTLNTCAPLAAATRRRWPARWLRSAVHAATAAYVAWGERSRARASWRAMQGLSDQTLRDIGLAERTPQQSHTLGLLDYERGRWQ